MQSLGVVVPCVWLMHSVRIRDEEKLEHLFLDDTVTSPNGIFCMFNTLLHSFHIVAALRFSTSKPPNPFNRTFWQKKKKKVLF